MVTKVKVIDTQLKMFQLNCIIGRLQNEPKVNSKLRHKYTLDYNVRAPCFTRCQAHCTWPDIRLLQHFLGFNNSQFVGGCGEKRLGISDIRCMSKSSQNVFLMDNLFGFGSGPTPFPTNRKSELLIKKFGFVSTYYSKNWKSELRTENFGFVTPPPSPKGGYVAVRARWTPVLGVASFASYVFCRMFSFEDYMLFTTSLWHAKPRFLKKKWQPARFW